MEPLFESSGIRRADTYLAASRMAYHHSTAFISGVILYSMIGLLFIFWGAISWINGTFPAPVKRVVLFTALLMMGLLAFYTLCLQPERQWKQMLKTSKILIGAAYSFSLFPEGVVSRTDFEEIFIPYGELKNILENNRLVVFQAEQLSLVLDKSEITLGYPEQLSTFLRSLPCPYSWKGGRHGG